MALTINDVTLENVTVEFSNPVGQVAFTTPGTYTWVPPGGVTSVCVVCVGGGGSNNQGSPYQYYTAGGGGGLGWKNNIPVVPGQAYTVVVGAGGYTNQLNVNLALPGGDSYFIDPTVVMGGGGGVDWYTSPAGGPGGTYVGDGGGNGGAGAGYGGSSDSDYQFGGGGAGGYLGTGGNGGGGRNVNGTGPGLGYAGFPPATGSGGGAGGGYQVYGGGVGIYGWGADGIAYGRTFNFNTKQWIYYSGTAGSAGSGQVYGGGGNNYFVGGIGYVCQAGGKGAVRIIWGPGRAFPATNTGDM